MPKLDVVIFEPRPPGSLAGRVRLWRLVAEEVDIDRSGSLLPDDAELRSCLVGSEHRARQRTQSACLSDSDDHVGEHRPGHRSLDDRQFNTEQVLDTPIGPHASFLRARTMATRIARGPLRVSRLSSTSHAPGLPLKLFVLHGRIGSRTRPQTARRWHEGARSTTLVRRELLHGGNL